VWVENKETVMENIVLKGDNNYRAGIYSGWVPSIYSSAKGNKDAYIITILYAGHWN
jgi:hypothetical protein